MIDRGVGVFAPAAASRRMKARLQNVGLDRRLTRLGNAYDGADTGHRLGRWRPPPNSATAAIGFHLPLLRSRCRDLERNTEWAVSAIRGMTASVMGTGFKPRFEEGDELRRQAWRDWAESTECDFERRVDLAALQVRIERIRNSSGATIIVQRYRENGRVNGRKVPPICLQVLEGDFLDDSKIEDLPSGGRIIHGVETDAQGAIVAYWLFDRHPGDATARTPESHRVPAEFVLHYYHEQRAGQRAGIPLLATIILRLRDWGDFVDGQLLRQKIAAAFAAFIYDDIDGEEPSNDAQLGKVDQELIQELEPGTLSKLRGGQRVETTDPPTVGEFEQYSVATLLAIAKAVGIPYELLTGDFSRSNFAASRMAWLAFWGEIDQLHVELVKPVLLDRLWRWFEVAARSLAGLKGFDDSQPAPDWRAPKRTLNDVVRESRVTIEELRAGLTTYEDVWLSRDLDPVDMFKRLEQQRERIDKHNLVLAGDARKFAPIGSAQVDPSQLEGDGSGGDDPPPARGGKKK